MSLLIAGSIATDHLMSFGGKFADSLVVEQLDKLSVSFLVDDLEIRRGGCAGNICFGLGRLGLSPVLVGAVGEDFADYRSWLERHGVDCESVHVSDSRHTARFVCTTDT
ncbi:MAG: adenosine kinase, partial [Nocardioidaceae bacterium]|nr:adenosine kinase [Nocardioidaceae bacterium]